MVKAWVCAALTSYAQIHKKVGTSMRVKALFALHNLLCRSANKCQRCNTAVQETRRVACYRAYGRTMQWLSRDQRYAWQMRKERETVRQLQTASHAFSSTKQQRKHFAHSAETCATPA